MDLNSLDIRQKTVSGQRYYEVNGQDYLSVTTAIGEWSDKSFLIEWRKRIGDREADRIIKASASRGRQLHNICERYFNNEPLNLETEKPIAIGLFRAIEPYLQNIDEVYGIEFPLYSDKLQLAGTCDLFCHYKRESYCTGFENIH